MDYGLWLWILAHGLWMYPRWSGGNITGLDFCLSYLASSDQKLTNVFFLSTPYLTNPSLFSVPENEGFSNRPRPHWFLGSWLTPTIPVE